MHVQPDPTSLADAERRLERARRRAAEAARGSPDWDAAMDEVEELEARVEALRRATAAA